VIEDLKPEPAVEPAIASRDPAVAIDDCWARIGVAGDRSCEHLKQHVHCRNCPVYAAAGERLLDRSLMPDYRREWALHFTNPKVRLSPGSVSLVLFRIGPEWLALPTPAFQEVVQLRQIHTIPHRRQGALLGIVSIRGELLVAVSLARVLGLEHSKKGNGTPTNYQRLLVSNWESQRVVFPVDEVHGVHRCDSEQMGEPPATLSKSGTSYTRAMLHWQGNLVCCLDASLLFPALSQSIA
jgi:chemotaxis-related protein WspD